MILRKKICGMLSERWKQHQSKSQDNIMRKEKSSDLTATLRMLLQTSAYVSLSVGTQLDNYVKSALFCRKVRKIASLSLLFVAPYDVILGVSRLLLPSFDSISQNRFLIFLNSLLEDGGTVRNLLLHLNCGDVAGPD